MIVCEAMTRNPVTVSPGDTLRSALGKMCARGVPILPVVDCGKLVGMLTDQDSWRRSADIGRRKVMAAMDRYPPMIAAEAGLEQAAQALIDLRSRGLVVVEGNRVVGVLTTTDLVRASLATLRSHDCKHATIVVRPRGGRLGLAEISNIVRGHGGDLLATAQDTHHPGAHRLRVSAPDPAVLMTALGSEGHVVLAVLGPPNGGGIQGTVHAEHLEAAK